MIDTVISVLLWTVALIVLIPVGLLVLAFVLGWFSNWAFHTAISVWEILTGKVRDQERFLGKNDR